MPKTIQIEGVGNVEFPDGMDDAAISRAIETEILSKPGVAKNVPGTVANTASKRPGVAKGSRVPVDTFPSIGSDVSAWDVAKSAGKGLLSLIPSLDPSGIESLGLQMASKVGTDMATEMSRGNSMRTSKARTVLRSIPVVGDLAAKLTSPATAYMSGRAPLKAENLDVVEGTAQLGGMAVGGKLASDLPASRVPGTHPRVPLPDVWEGPEPAPGTVIKTRVPAAATDLPNKPGAVRQLASNAAGFVLPQKVHAALEPLWRGGPPRPKTIRVPVADAAYGDAAVPPIRPTDTSNFDPRNPTVFRGSTEDSSLSPPTISDDFAYGDAPTQPLIQPREIGPEYDPRTGYDFGTRAVGPKNRTSPQFIREPSVEEPAAPAPPAGRFISRKSIPLAPRSQSRVSTTTPNEAALVEQAGAAQAAARSTPTPTTSRVPSWQEWQEDFRTKMQSQVDTRAAAQNESLIGATVRFSEGAARHHGTVESILPGGIARVRTSAGIMQQIPIGALTTLRKVDTLSTEASP